MIGGFVFWISRRLSVLENLDREESAGLSPHAGADSEVGLFNNGDDSRRKDVG
jgi:hypothetical protein